MKAKIIKVTKDLFSKLDFKDIEIKVKKGQDDGYEINLKVNPEDSGMLIGFHGETISSLQLILSHLVNYQTESWHRLTINVNDYRERRNKSLSEMAINAASQAKDSGDPVALPAMGSFDRRIIHMNLADDSEVETYSDGLGLSRHIIIAPSTQPKTSK